VRKKRRGLFNRRAGKLRSGGGGGYGEKISGELSIDENEVLLQWGRKKIRSSKRKTKCRIPPEEESGQGGGLVAIRKIKNKEGDTFKKKKGGGYLFM